MTFKLIRYFRLENSADNIFLSIFKKKSYLKIINKIDYCLNKGNSNDISWCKTFIYLSLNSSYLRLSSTKPNEICTHNSADLSTDSPCLSDSIKSYQKFTYTRKITTVEVFVIK